MITIDLRSPIPVVDQIVRSLTEAVLAGTVAPGQALPSARQVAGDLGVHWNTVARAYRVLADDGLVYVVRGRRAVVRPKEHWAQAARASAVAEILGHLRAAVRHARSVGMEGSELRALLDREYCASGERSHPCSSS